MKQIFIIVLLLFGCISVFAQQPITVSQEMISEYNRYMKLKKAGVTGIVVFGVTWLAGELICVTEQNLYANDRWDGIDSKEYARLSSEATKLPSYKRGMAMGIVGCVGTGVSIFLTAKYGTKARRIRDSHGDVVGSLSMNISPLDASLVLTF